MGGPGGTPAGSPALLAISLRFRLPSYAGPGPPFQLSAAASDSAEWCRWGASLRPQDTSGSCSHSETPASVFLSLSRGNQEKRFASWLPMAFPASNLCTELVSFVRCQMRVLKYKTNRDPTSCRLVCHHFICREAISMPQILGRTRSRNKRKPFKPRQAGSVEKLPW